MTTQGKSLEKLGRRAVACKHWRWMPGCAWTWAQSHGRMNKGRVPDFASSIPGDAVPDLSDPATLGCLLYLVREAWKDSDLTADRVLRGSEERDIWQVYVFHDSGVKDVLSGHSEVEALVAALGAAP